MTEVSKKLKNKNNFFIKKKTINMFSNILQAKTNKREYSFQPRKEGAKLGLESETTTMLLFCRLHEILRTMLRNEEIEAGLGHWSIQKR